jgi:hypothetical protein
VGVDVIPIRDLRPKGTVCIDLKCDRYQHHNKRKANYCIMLNLLRDPLENDWNYCRNIGL